MADTVRAPLEAIRDRAFSLRGKIPASTVTLLYNDAVAALALTERLEILIRQMIADDRKRGGRLYGGIWHDDPLKLEAWALVEDPRVEADSDA